jgi:hypothetical protein
VTLDQSPWRKTVSKHTQGDWRYRAQGDANHYCILTEDGKWVISFLQNGEILTEEQEANMRLIAAAPDLLAALEAWTEWAVNRDIPFPLIAQTRAAIAKAS